MHSGSAERARHLRVPGTGYSVPHPEGTRTALPVPGPAIVFPKIGFALSISMFRRSLAAGSARISVDGRFAFGGFGTGAAVEVAAVGFDLLLGGHGTAPATG